MEGVRAGEDGHEADEVEISLQRERERERERESTKNFVTRIESLRMQRAEEHGRRWGEK